MKSKRYDMQVMSPRSKRTFILRLAVAVLVISSVTPAAPPQSGSFQVDYTVKVSSLTERLFHVTTEIKNIRQPILEVSLPTWTPGWYTIENYLKNVLRFKVVDGKGSPVRHTMSRKQTWRLETSGLDRITVDFDYRADILALNQSKITNDYAFFTGTQLFLMAEGHRDAASTVRFQIPDGWKIVSALKETADPMVFTAPDYDTLADAATEMGKFDVTRFEVKGKPHYFTSTPAGVFSKERTDRFVQMLQKITEAQSAIFGELPYEKYVYFYFFDRPESNAAGALEHLNSQVAFAPPVELALPERMINLASHELFHVWNVKRIRPAEMWPYDYSRENETPLLWVSEGFTNYYGSLTVYRAGLADQNQFLASVGDAVSGVEGNEARAYISPAASSISTWVGYDTPVAFGISYYTQGQNLAALLDLSIRNDTAGKSGLDDVMRALYRNYQTGKGFTADQLVGIINNLTKRDYGDFFQRYVWGTQVPQYDVILGHAGYKLERVSQPTPQIGVSLNITPQGAEVTRVEPGSTAAQAGLQSGDILLNFDGVEVRRGLRAVRDHLITKRGGKVKVTFRRGEKEQSVEVDVKTNLETGYRLVEAPQPSAQQLKVRESWLNRTIH